MRDTVSIANRTHGLYGTYTIGCRCQPCVLAYSEYVEQLRDRRALRLAADPSIVPHGRASTYQRWGCRCDDCRAAAAAYARAIRARKKAAS